MRWDSFREVLAEGGNSSVQETSMYRGDSQCRPHRPENGGVDEVDAHLKKKKQKTSRWGTAHYVASFSHSAKLLCIKVSHCTPEININFSWEKKKGGGSAPESGPTWTPNGGPGSWRLLGHRAVTTFSLSLIFCFCFPERQEAKRIQGQKEKQPVSETKRKGVYGTWAWFWKEAPHTRGLPRIPFGDHYVDSFQLKK